MSTDVIKFPSNQRNFSPAALQTYLAISIPFMLITFLASWIYYRHVRQKDKLRWKNSDLENGDRPPFDASQVTPS